VAALVIGRDRTRRCVTSAALPLGCAFLGERTESFVSLIDQRTSYLLTALDDSAGRWAALTAPEPPLQVDRAAGADYHVWPAAAPAAWRTLSRSGFALLSPGAAPG